MAKKQEQNAVVLKKIRSQFNYVGKAIINDYTFKMHNEYKSGWVDNILNLGVNCGDGNVAYCDMKGGYHTRKDSVIYVNGYTEDVSGRKKDDYKNKFTIEWDDRFDDAILETVADSCFITIGIEKDTKNDTFTKRFLSAYDAIEYLQENLSGDYAINIKGNLSYRYYNGEVRMDKNITSIFLSRLEEQDFKATFSQTILYDSDCIGEINKDKNTIEISAYVVDYISKVRIDNEDYQIKKNIVLRKGFELKINDNVELTQKFIKKFFKPKKGKINEMTVVGNIIESGNVKQIDYEEVPSEIKELVELGLYTEEEAKARCVVGGSEREKRFIILKPEVFRSGRDDNAVVSVAFEESKYDHEDLIFIEDEISKLETNDNTNIGNDEDVEANIDTEEDDDLMSLLSNM